MNQYPFIYPQDPTYQWFNSTDTPRGNFWQRKLQFAVQDPGIPHLKSGAIIRLGVSGNPRFLGRGRRGNKGRNLFFGLNNQTKTNFGIDI